MSWLNHIRHCVAGVMIFMAAVFFFLLPGQAHAQISDPATLVLNDEHPSVTLGPHLYVTKDPEAKLTYEDIIARHQSGPAGERKKRTLITLGLTPQPVWMVLTVTNNASTEDWILHFGKTMDGRFGGIKKLWVHNQTENISYTRALGEKGVPGSYGEDLLGPALPVKIGKGKTDTIIIYMEAEGGIPTAIAPRLINNKAYIDSLRKGSLPSIIAGTFLIVMAGFFMAVLYIRKRPSYFSFLLYYIAHAALYFLIDSSFFSSFAYNANVIIFLYAATTIIGLFITKFFLEVSVEEHAEYYGLYVIGGLLLAACILNIFIIDEKSGIGVIAILGVKSLALIGIAAIAYRQKRREKFGAKPYMLAWLSAFTGSSITSLALLGVLPSIGLTDTAYWIFLFPQAALFITATLTRIKLNNEKTAQLRMREYRQEVNQTRLKQSKESADQARLLRVIERERELMAELRERELQRTEEMRKAKEAADQANRAKSAFLAVVSHEIRTPMTGIMGMVKLLLDTKLGNNQKDYALAIQKSGDTMMALLNDILDFEKSEGGKMELEHVDFDLPRLVQDVVMLMSGKAMEKSIYLKSDIRDGVPRFVLGDPTRLRQVLLNLVTNAIKFTQEGGVTILLKANPLLEKDNAIKGDYEVHISVQDTGIGIPKEARASLFTPFTQADSSVSRKYGGTGLGLAICKRLIGAMGSTIEVDSKEGEGSNFHFTILMEEGHESKAEEIQSNKESALTKGIPPKRILVVEDNEMNRRVLQGLLEKYGHTTVMAKSGEEALEKCKRESPFDLILMDIQLTGMSGDETTRTLRTMPDRRIASTPVIALTGNVMMQDITKYYEANMNGHIAKPIQIDQLLESIRRVHKGNLENPVVVLDANDPNRFLKMATSLELDDREVFADDTDDDETPMPLNMPHIQKTPAPEITPTQPQPSIFQKFAKKPAAPPIEQPSRPQTVEDPFHLSASDLDIDSFDEAVREESTFVPPAVSNPATNYSSSDYTHDSDIDMSVLDHEMLGSLLENLGKAQFAALVEGFLSKADEIIATLNQVSAQNDLPAMGARAHELKGMAANFGIKGVSEIAAKAEKASKLGHNDEARENIAKLDDAGRNARAAIKKWLAEN